ncbi:hypothetical protein [Planctomicrobium sp. SH664]|uniref:hypothetical protein n=1 Tax=Planctomicrobium sp. SH664 TaxID=3448125 RepID=UPI003F5C65F3
MPYRQLIALMPCHSLEDFPTELGERPAASLLNAFAVLWHPQLLAEADALPRWMRADDEYPDYAPGRLMIVPIECEDIMPYNAIEDALAAGVTVVRGEHERSKMLEAALAHETVSADLDPDLVADFFALGMAWLQVELLTRHMRNFSHVDDLQLLRDVKAAAAAALQQDNETARTHLGHCFEHLQECRERFYPVECYLIDVCLVTPTLAGPALSTLLETNVPVNLMAPGRTWEAIDRSDAAWGPRVRTALEQQKVELIGGDDVELMTTLQPLDSTLWHLQQGRGLYRKLFGKVPTVWGRKRFGLGTHLPALLRRLDYEGALHLLLDDGTYPEEEQTHLSWEGSDGESIDAYSRIPLAADSAAGMLKFPLRMSESMDSDHSAAVLFVRWPDLRTPFFEDLRRAHAYAPVLGRFVFLSEYFQLASAPGRRSSFAAGGYFSPELVQTVARRLANPLSRWVANWDRRLRFQRAAWLAGATEFIRSGRISAERDAALEQQLELAHPEADAEAQSQADQSIAAAEEMGTAALVKLLCGSGRSGPGMLIANPCSFSRKTLVHWPQGAPAPHDSVLNQQIDEQGCRALVEVPPCGFLWLANNEETLPPTVPGKVKMAEGLTLRNDLFEVHLSEVTGGIAQILTYQRSPNRISQQIAWRFPYEKTVTVHEGDEPRTFDTFYTAMQLRESRILSAGPLIGEIETRGELIDQQTAAVLGTYRQVTRVVRGKPNVEVEIELDLPQAPTGDPWTNYVACRFAWKHESVAVTASMQQGAHGVKAARIEAPQYVEIADENYRTTILTSGLIFHRRTGERMIDSLLVVEGEESRQFRFVLAIDAPYPLQAQLDAFLPPVTVATESRPQGAAQAGWFFQVNAANVQLTRLLPSAKDNSIVVRLLETEGRGRTTRLRCFRTPVSARQLDFNGKSIVTLNVEADGVVLEIAPYELCDVELTFS